MADKIQIHVWDSNGNCIRCGESASNIIDEFRSKFPKESNEANNHYNHYNYNSEQNMLIVESLMWAIYSKFPCINEDETIIRDIIT